jgi:hypothetical protein
MKDSSKKRTKRGRKHAKTNTFSMGVLATYIATKVWHWGILMRSARNPGMDPPKELIDYIESCLVDGAMQAGGGLIDVLLNVTGADIWYIISGQAGMDAANVIYDTVQRGTTWVRDFLTRDDIPYAGAKGKTTQGKKMPKSKKGRKSKKMPKGHIPKLLYNVFKGDIKKGERTPRKTRKTRKRKTQRK